MQQGTKSNLAPSFVHEGKALDIMYSLQFLPSHRSNNLKREDVKNDKAVKWNKELNRNNGRKRAICIRKKRPFEIQIQPYSQSNAQMK